MSELTRNTPCWCGSGLKYKICHLTYDEMAESAAQTGREVFARNMVKTPIQIEAIRQSAQLNTAVLDEAAKHIRVGISTAEIDDAVYEFTSSHKAVPAPFNYQGFPKSCCISINDVICHGIPSKNTFLKEGDIVNIDVSTVLNGYFSDASRMFTVGKVTPQAQKLVRVAKECLDNGVEQVRPGGFTGDIACAIQTYAEASGFSVVREFGGHGVGCSFHEDPFISHIGQKGFGILLAPGMIFTIEPMINEGSPDLFIDEQDGWTVRTHDGKLSAQWEYTVLVTPDGVEILTY